MTVAELIALMNNQEVVSQGGVLLLVVLTLLQVSPIKLNPWSWFGKLIGALVRWLGKELNGDVMQKLGRIEEKLSELEKHDQEQDATRAEDKALDARRRILQFADEIRRKVRHSEEHFNNVFEDIKYYKTYCQEHPTFANDKARISIGIIESTYEKCACGDEFL